jgi:hypothetical protein
MLSLEILSRYWQAHGADALSMEVQQAVTTGLNETQTCSKAVSHKLYSSTERVKKRK